jgi:hypothetical protein
VITNVPAEAGDIVGLVFVAAFRELEERGTLAGVREITIEEV